jgi:thiamine biosynthesis lipoprotein
MQFKLSWLLAGAAVLPLTAPIAAQAQAFRYHYDHVLGTSLDLVAVAGSEPSALIAASAARQEIERLDGLLSAWRPDGELARLNATPSASARVSPELFEVLQRCEQWRGATDGAFDCRLGNVLESWRSGQAVNRASLRAALARDAIGLNAKGRLVSRPDGARLSVDGMAKGYVIDAALAAARKASPDLKGLMVDIGGDLRCWGQAPQTDGWRVGLAHGGDADNATPAQSVRLSEGAVAVSGRGARDLRPGVTHVLDPATGCPASGAQHAVVKAKTAADADALATAFMVMPPQKAIAMADRMDGVEAQVIDDRGMRHVSAGWSDLVDRSPRPGLIRAAAGDLGLDAAYTVPKIDAVPYHAPYVVMWVTDANHKMVRTLLALGVKDHWAAENFVWWKRYGRLEPQVFDTIARPTRLPGHYTAHWDGKDEGGKPVAPGHYILHIEAAREKGGHTYQSVDVDLTGTGGAKSLPAKDEMGAVDIKFGPGA